MYNVERYLSDCLESLAHQTHADLEVIMIDDGSTDSSADLARRYAERDRRFRLVQQPNGGLGNARNTGADLATGDYLTFVDSDDVVVTNAYELLSGSLEQTGSDFASGNYHRLKATGTWQAGIVAETFRANRPRTHVSKHPALLTDRTAWNKLFRRSFWVEHGFRWPEGVLYEDTPVTLPAHVLARSVDVLRQPIYLWRSRAGDSSSITQQRSEPRAIRDRTSAVDSVSRFLADRGEHSLKKQYDRLVAEQDFRFFLTVLDVADDEFRTLFMDLVNDFFDRAAPDVFDDLPAIQRLEWHLVRRRLLPELLEVLRFEKSGDISRTPVIRKGRRFWGDYPFRTDSELAIPDQIYRLRRDELPMIAMIEDVSWQGDRLNLTGYAYIAFMDLAKKGSARIRLTMEESGHPESVVPLDVRVVRRPDVTEAALDGVTCYDWCGFEASVPATAMRHQRQFRDGNWRLRVEVRAHGITRRRWLARTAPGPAKRPEPKVIDGVRVTPVTEVGDFAFRVGTSPAEVTELRVDGTVLEVHGTLHNRGLDPATSELVVARRDGTRTLRYPAAADGARSAHGQGFLARLPLDELTSHDGAERVAPVDGLAEGNEWELSLLPDAGSRRTTLDAAPGVDSPRLTLGFAEIVVRPTRTGRLTVVEQSFRPEVDRIRWTDQGILELEGSYHAPADEPVELELLGSDVSHAYTVPIGRERDRFTASFQPEAMDTLAGRMPLREGRWDLHVRAGSAAERVRVKVDRGLFPSLPSSYVSETRQFTVLDVEYDRLSIESGSDRARSLVGPAGRRRLERVDYPAFLRLPRREQILVDGYGSGQYADDVRALHEELARRAVDVDVVWSVVDGQAVLPAGVRPLPRLGKEWYEALACARFVIAADYRGVSGLAKPAHQRVLQTWHGVPVKGVGLDDPGVSVRFGRGWQRAVRQEAAQWDLLLSTGPAASAVLRSAFDFQGEIVESGLPRHDLLVSPERDKAARAVRERLAIPPDRKVVLYAPTYTRDQPHRRSQRSGLDRYRFELEFDLADVGGAMTDNAVFLLRTHPKSVDGVPEADGATFMDVTQWPDPRDLLLLADVLVTDRSSLLLDFALTGKPIVRWAPDGHPRTQPASADYLDLATFPGPSVTTPTEMLEAVDAALRGAPTTVDSYRSVLGTWCPAADGRSAARALDALLAQ
jgi:CDP-glycerol glycerophosphotransferase